MRILGLTVGKNEADRYLESMLLAAREVVDEHFYYDDASDDDSLEMAADIGCCTVSRHPANPSFSDNEGRFRQAAWNTFESVMRPERGDWVVVLDCDEVLASRTQDVRSALHCTITSAGVCAGVMLDIKEVFGFFSDGRPQLRVDRLWNTIHAPRLFPYRPGAQWPNHHYGVPAVPSYVMAGSWSSPVDLLIMHFGYAVEEDRKMKYERYRHDRGHNRGHIESILVNDMLLDPWFHPWPDVHYGRLTKVRHL